MLDPFLRYRLLRACLATVAVAVSIAAQATGMQPDTPLLVMAEADGSAQMALRNTDNEPLLLHTTIIDAPEDKGGPAVYALPPVIRVEANGRQVVRFILEKTDQPMAVQHYKRVRFEGIPATIKDQSSKAIVRVNVAQELPIVISPKGLEQDKEPWKKITWKLDGNKVIVSNPSPFVARLSQEVNLLPSGKQVRLLQRSYVLPNESFSVALPEGTDAASVTALRLQPASPYGFSVAPYEVQLSR